MGGDGSLKEILSNSSFVREYKAIRALGLKPLEYLILNEILSYNMQGLEFSGSQGYICKEFNVTNKTALKALKSLTDKGYIIKSASNGGNASIYKADENKLKSVLLNYGENTQLTVEKLHSSKTPTVEKLHSQLWRNYTVNCGESPQNNNIYKNIYKNTIHGQTDVRPTGSDKNKNDQISKLMTDMFDKFWAEYPKKVKKSVALKKWKTLKPTEKLFEDIMRALRIQKESYDWQKENGRFIPHPITWLNQRRWEDITEAEKEEAQEVRYIVSAPKPLIDELGGE